MTQPAQPNRASPTDAPPAAEQVWAAAQWDALSSPHRVQLLGLIESMHRATIRELSELTGRSGPSLYPHLRVLESAKLVSVETVKGPGRAYRVYCIGPALQWSMSQTGIPDSRGYALKLAIHWLRDAAIRLRRWSAVREGGPSQDMSSAAGVTISETTWLDDEQRMELNRRVIDLVTFLRRAGADRKGRRHNVMLYHFPDVTLRDIREHRDSRNGPTRRS